MAHGSRTLLPSAHARRPLLLPLALLGALLLPTAPAHADGCEDCPGPTLQDLQTQQGLVLEFRGDEYNGYWRDQVHTDAGECTSSLEGLPEITVLYSWIVLRGSGEVWNCPHSSSSDTITIESGTSDSSSWTLTTSLSLKLKGLTAELMGEISRGHTTGHVVHEVTRVSKTVSPAYCRRVAWQGYFEVAKVRATASFAFQQRWAWWTKNVTTGYAVHAKGEIHMPCGSMRLEMERHAPISGYFRITPRACSDPECASVVTPGPQWFPPLPEGLAPIEPLPEGARGEEEADGGTPSAPPETPPEPTPETTPEEPARDAPDDEQPWKPADSSELPPPPTEPVPDAEPPSDSTAPAPTSSADLPPPPDGGGAEEPAPEDAGDVGSDAP